MPWRDLTVSCEVGGNKNFVGHHLCPQKLDDKSKDELIEELYPIARSAFNQKDNPEFHQDVYDHVMMNSDVVVLSDLSGNPRAFRMWDRIPMGDSSVIYLAGMCVDKHSQGKGVGTSMLRYVVDHSSEHASEWSHMVLRTQNPVMQKCFAKVTGTKDLFLFGDKEIPQDVQNAATCIANVIDDTHLDPTTLVSRGVYGSSMYGRDYDIVKKSIGTNFASLDQDNGDAAYCVWRR